MALLLTKTFLIAALTSLGIVGACAGKSKPLDRFAETQGQVIQSKKAYIDADFDFSASMYEPTSVDLERLRAAWVEHGAAFPESRAFAEIEKEVMKSGQRIVLVSLFRTDYENADLTSKAGGWSAGPVPRSIKELQYDDVVLRTLMPVSNPWARFFMLIYSPEQLNAASELIVSNRTSSVKFNRGQ